MLVDMSRNQIYAIAENQETSRINKLEMGQNALVKGD